MRDLVTAHNITLRCVPDTSDVYIWTDREEVPKDLDDSFTREKAGDSYAREEAGNRLLKQVQDDLALPGLSLKGVAHIVVRPEHNDVPRVRVAYHVDSDDRKDLYVLVARRRFTRHGSALRVFYETPEQVTGAIYVDLLTETPDIKRFARAIASTPGITQPFEITYEADGPVQTSSGRRRVRDYLPRPHLRVSYFLNTSDDASPMDIQVQIACDLVRQHLDRTIGDDDAYTVSSKEKRGRHQEENLEVNHYVRAPSLNRLPGASTAASLFAGVHIGGPSSTTKNKARPNRRADKGKGKAVEALDKGKGKAVEKNTDQGKSKEPLFLSSPPPSPCPSPCPSPSPISNNRMVVYRTGPSRCHKIVLSSSPAPSSPLRPNGLFEGGPSEPIASGSRSRSRSGSRSGSESGVDVHVPILEASGSGSRSAVAPPSPIPRSPSLRPIPRSPSLRPNGLLDEGGPLEIGFEPVASGSGSRSRSRSGSRSGLESGSGSGSGIEAAGSVDAGFGDRRRQRSGESYVRDQPIAKRAPSRRASIAAALRVQRGKIKQDISSLVADKARLDELIIEFGGDGDGYSSDEE